MLAPLFSYFSFTSGRAADFLGYVADRAGVDAAGQREEVLLIVHSGQLTGFGTNGLVAALRGGVCGDRRRKRSSLSQPSGKLWDLFGAELPAAISDLDP